MTEKAGSTDQLRNTVNCKSGKMKDGAPEPAASPLGTDDEAAGVTATADRIVMAEEAEREIAAAAERKRQN